MPSVGFEPTISADERQQTCALDSEATGTGLISCYFLNKIHDVIPQKNANLIPPSENQRLPHLLWNPKFHYRIQNGLPLNSS
jgi:hypothetical protein